MAETRTPTTIAFVLYDGLTPLDLIGPLQAFTSLETLETMFGGDPAHEIVVVGERLEPMSTDTPVSLIPSATFADVPAPDVLIVPGGGMPTIRAATDDTLLDYVRSAASGADIVASVCTGALILAAAGLLDGRKATTHWAYHALLDRLGAHYLPERWVEDGKFVTAAGVSAGIDLAIHLIARLTNEDTARMVQLGIEYDPRPPFGGIDWSTVDRDVFAPVLAARLEEALADKPAMLARLRG